MHIFEGLFTWFQCLRALTSIPNVSPSSQVCAFAMLLLLIVRNRKVPAGMHFSSIILVPSFIKIGNWFRCWNGRVFKLRIPVVFYQYMNVKLQNCIVTHNSQFIRSLSFISSYIFRLVYRAILRLVFRVVYNCWCFESYEIFKAPANVHTNHSQD